jgi:hypothetical protein
MINARKPIGRSHSRLNHLDRPTRILGAMPDCAGTEPVQVAGSTTFSP